MLEGTFGCFALFSFLVFNVGADLLGLEPDGRHCVPACPEMFSGEVPFLAGELSGDRYCRLALQESDDRRHRIFWWDRDEHVDVVGHHVPFEDRAFFLFRQFVKEGADGLPDVSIQGFPPTFGHEHDVIFAVPF